MPEILSSNPNEKVSKVNYYKKTKDLFVRQSKITKFGIFAVLLLTVGIIVINKQFLMVSQKAQLTPDSQVTVNSNTPLNTISDIAYGVNTRILDNNILNPDLQNDIRNLGVTALRFPGGSIGDIYHWQSNTFVKKNKNNNVISTPAPMSFDDFMTVAKAVNAQPIITVNYESNAAYNSGGDIAEATSWVSYANLQKHYAVKYWTIGNEEYGGGFYPSAKWQNDLHPDNSPYSYATNSMLFSRAMKAVDPTINVGISLLTTGQYQQISDIKQGANPWNIAVLSTPGLCDSIDYIDIHWYPSVGGNASTLLASPAYIPSIVSALRGQLTSFCTISNKDYKQASHIQIIVGETNGSTSSKIQSANGLFLADSILSWLENGVSNVDWFQFQQAAATLLPDNSYNDSGLLAGGNCINTDSSAAACPAGFARANFAYATYFSYKMLTYFGKASDQFVAALSLNSNISVHAVKNSNGNLSVMLINKDSASHVAGLSLPDFPNASVTAFNTYAHSDINNTDTISNIPQNIQTSNGQFLVPLSPSSINVVNFSSVGNPTRHLQTTPTISTAAGVACDSQTNRCKQTGYICTNPGVCSGHDGPHCVGTCIKKGEKGVYCTSNKECNKGLTCSGRNKVGERVCN